MNHQPRFDGVFYRDCKWCRASGKHGCNQCAAEADKEYKRQFPDGPQPIATFKTDSPMDMAMLSAILGKAGLKSAHDEAEKRIEDQLSGEVGHMVNQMLGEGSVEKAKPLMVADETSRVLAERFSKFGGSQQIETEE